MCNKKNVIVEVYDMSLIMIRGERGSEEIPIISMEKA